MRGYVTGDRSMISGCSLQRAMPGRRSAPPSGSMLRNVKSTSRSFCMAHAFLGPAYSDDEIEQFLHWSKLPYRRVTHLIDVVADIMVLDKNTVSVRHEMKM